MRNFKQLLVFLLAYQALAAASQPALEERELNGVVDEISIGPHLAYSMLTMKTTEGVTYDLQFGPEFGKIMMDAFRKGSPITLRAQLRYPASDQGKRRWPVETGMFFLLEDILEVVIDGTWVNVARTKPDRRQWQGDVFLQRRVKELYKVGSHTRALIFDDGTAAYDGSRWKTSDMEGIKRGDMVSFIGSPYIISSECVYPISGVNRVYSFQRLFKKEGRFKSLLFKQNFVCIGMSLETSQGDVTASFPTKYAREIQESGDAGQVTIYVSDYKIDGQLHPVELHALISGSDTLEIKEMGFYGGADGRHEYTPVTVQGKVTDIINAGSGRVTGLIIDNKIYVDVDPTVARQLGGLLKRGKQFEITGDERIKKDGELYSKDYRIVAPREIKADDKVFLINTRP